MKLKNIILFMVMLFITMWTPINGASLVVNDVTIKSGQKEQLTINMNNSETNLSGFQFVLSLPQGVTIDKNEKNKFIYSLSNRISDHTLSITALNDGRYQFICYSMDGDLITGTSGELLSVTITADNSFTTSGNGTLSDIKLTNINAQKTTCSNVGFHITLQVPASSISLDKPSLTFTAKNQTATLTATVLPSKATNKSVTWTSSNTSVATVDANGKVTAVANGTATITAKTNDGSNLSATCTVTVEIPEPFSNNKLYTLTCKRGGLVMNADGTGLAAGQTRTDAPEADKRFAIITYNGGYYLYSPTVKQYLLADGSFVSRLGSAITFDDSKADGEYKYMLSTQGTNGETWYFNNNGNIVINGWDAADDGNRWLIEPVADFDPTEALAMASNQTYMVTYEVLFEGKVVATASEEVASGSALPTVPYPLANSFVILNKIGTHPTTVTKDITVQFAATWNGPFELSKDEATAKWYNMHIHNGWYVGKQNSEPYYPTDNAGDALNTKEYQWAFGGDPYHIKVYNRTTGFAETLSKDGENAVMRSGEYSWDLLSNNGGFVLRETGTDYNCINQFGGYGGPLKFWNDGWSPTDDGSTFRVEEAQPIDENGISNWENDVIAENLPAKDFTDETLDIHGWVLFTPEVKANDALQIVNGKLTTNSGTVYTINPDKKNALVLKTANTPKTLNFTTPVKCGTIYFMAISSEGTSTLEAVVNYDDGSKESAKQFSVLDWYSTQSGQGEAIYGFDRIKRITGDGYEADVFNGLPNFRIFEYMLPVNKNKTVVGITFTNTSSAIPSVLGVTTSDETVEMSVVTYEILYDGKVVATATEEVVTGSNLPELPASLKNEYITLTKSGTHPTKVTKDVTVKFIAKWNGPFEFSKNVTNAKWYNMTIRSNYYVGKQESEPYYPTADAGDLLKTKAYHWAFGGDPYHVKVYNRTTDFTETLSKDGENAVMRSGDYTWYLLANNGGFVLRETGTDYNCINQLGGGGGPLGFWNDSQSLTDVGSTFRVEEAQPIDEKILATSISLDQTSLTFTAKNETAILTATVLPDNATNKSVTWTSSNTSVATVDANGKVTAVANGTATITAKTNDGSNLSATCKVTVEIPIIATSISLSKTSLTFTAKNQTATLTATVLPSNATNKSVTWTSNKTSVATVDANGKVTAVANGSATITAKTNDGSKLTERVKLLLIFQNLVFSVTTSFIR